MPYSQSRSLRAIIAAPFRWIARQLSAFWAKIAGSRKKTFTSTQVSDISASNPPQSLKSRPEFVPPQMILKSEPETMFLDDLLAFCKEHKIEKRSRKNVITYYSVSEIINNLEATRADKIKALKELTAHVLNDKFEELHEKYNSNEFAEKKWLSSVWIPINDQEIQPRLYYLWSQGVGKGESEKFILYLRELDEAITIFDSKVSRGLKLEAESPEEFNSYLKEAKTASLAWKKEVRSRQLTLPKPVGSVFPVSDIKPQVSRPKSH